MREDVCRGVVLWGTKNVFYVLPHNDYNSYMQDANIQEMYSNNIIECRLKGKRQHNEGDVCTTFCTASDNVEYVVTNPTTIPMQGLIIKRHERKNKIVRNKGNRQHLVAVNIDVLGIVTSVGAPMFKPQFIDRILCIALQQKLDTLLIINKVDIWNEESTCQEEEIEKIKDAIKIYTEMCQIIVYTSVPKKTGMKELVTHLKGKRCAFVGQSGVGKSSIVNFLISCASQKIGEVSKKYNRGKHTTICPTVNIGEGFYIIDTPGIRDLSPANVTTRDIGLGYYEFLKFSVQCKHSKCLHYKEPGCAVKEQVGKAIRIGRYKSYIQLLAEILEREKVKWYRKKH